MRDQLPRGSLKAAMDAIGQLDDAELERTSGEAVMRLGLLAALPVIERAAVRRAAARIALLQELANGWRCPACHGKPASTPHMREGRTGYTCGCGCSWEPPKSGTIQVGYLVRKLARGEPLPDLPPKLTT
jgi:hypothetical protein